MTIKDSHDQNRSNTPFGHAMTKGANHVTVQLHGKSTSAPEQVTPIDAGPQEDDVGAPEAISKFDRPSADLEPEADKPDDQSGISAA